MTVIADTLKRPLERPSEKKQTSNGQSRGRHMAQSTWASHELKHNPQSAHSTRKPHEIVDIANCGRN